MVQNPRQYPRRHAPSRVQCSLTGTGLPGQARLDAGRVSPTATLLHARVGQAPIDAGRASPAEPGQENGRPTPRRRLLSMRQNTPSVIIQPVLIWRNALDQVESSLTGRMPPNGLNTPDRVHSFRWCAYCPRRCGAGVRAQASSLDDAWDRAATNTLCPMNRQARRMAPGHHATPKRRRTSDSATNSGQSDTRPRPVSRPRPRQ